jgi:hypothetical protein
MLSPINFNKFDNSNKLNSNVQTSMDLLDNYKWKQEEDKEVGGDDTVEYKDENTNT